ncbi:hypothetical protein E2C01_042555 [Portunus trituberculatus]|uniref:Uncharacterized protein n=1 Tax=Portunus trituberculatus TaxID=210409 RepID=A0A5B7FQJ3_PORTR|nr:hypothetical protein [Portunus trituberculatus]
MIDWPKSQPRPPVGTKWRLVPRKAFALHQPRDARSLAKLHYDNYCNTSLEHKRSVGGKFK